MIYLSISRILINIFSIKKYQQSTGSRENLSGNRTAIQAIIKKVYIERPVSSVKSPNGRHSSNGSGNTIGGHSPGKKFGNPLTKKRVENKMNFFSRPINANYITINKNE